MRLFLILLILLSFLTMSLCGCASLLLPYEEEPLCKLGVEGGYCGSLSDVYEAVNNQQCLEKNKKCNKKKVEYVK